MRPSTWRQSAWTRQIAPLILASVLGLTACGSVSHFARSPGEGVTEEFAVTIVPIAPSGEMRLPLFRSHFALRRVGVPAYHFIVWAE